MKKKYFWSLLTIMMVAMLSIGIASCGSDDDDEPSIPDPEGTIATLLEPVNGGIDFFNYSSKLSIHANNDGTLNFRSLNSGLEIYDCGSVKGLAEITSIPTTGWVRASSEPAAIEGHGYVVRYTNTNFKVQLYASMYLIKRVYEQEGHSAIKGYEIKYLYPFKTTNN